jgi:hypothetical protein
MITQSSGASTSRLAGRVRRRPERVGRQECPRERLEAMDGELARRAGEAARLRFEIGRGLDCLHRSGGHHVLGFSSLESYALERCERSASWTQKARALACRLEAVPALADALLSGSLSWSMAAVVATVATPGDADFWLTEATHRTVRQMKELVSERRFGTDSGEPLEVEDELRTLTITVPREDAWCFEQAKMLARQLNDGPHGTDADVMLALVGESTSTLCGELPRSAIAPADDNARDPQREWERELARMRMEAETRCEAHLSRSEAAVLPIERLHWPGSPEAIDRQLRELSRELLVREVAYGRALEAFFAADGWRRLGYATTAQYARERLGSSLSSVKSKRQLAKRLAQLRFLANALERGELGFEAARLVARVATCDTERAWVARAKQRTLRHLREEIDAAELLARWSDSAVLLPPSDAEVRRVQELERAVVTGQISAAPPPHSAAQGPSANVTLRVRVRASTGRDYRHWEALYLRHRSGVLRSTTFLRFACELFADTWRPERAEVAYAPIYDRDRHRCQSPCCGRRDLTPHHLRFRSHGGDDSDENLTSLCTWCHLEGIHGGQMSAAPPASAIRWTFGRSPHTVVEGRRRTRFS